MSEIQNINSFEHDGRLYKTLEEAERAKAADQNWIYVNVSYVPNLEDGNGYFKSFTLGIVPPTKLSKDSKLPIWVMNAVENILSKDKKPYQGVFGTCDYRKTVLIRSWKGTKEDNTSTLPPIYYDDVPSAYEEELEAYIQKYLEENIGAF